jgi:UDP-N-acetylmuramoyl-tripeptide--D-alanyl-D-alanine ligase
MYLLLNTLWFIRTLKYVLFWLYLWQLKEYHVGRFIDHFRTYKGKKLIFNAFSLSKIILIFLFAFENKFFSVWFIILLIIYLFESLIFVRQLFLKTFKKPVTTFKVLLLTFISFVFVVLFLGWVNLKVEDFSTPIYLLSFDILISFIISAIVLLLQPLSVFARSKILKRASAKMETSKDLKVVAITGSYGKTSTKEFLSTILSEKFKVLSTKEHQNSEIGIAKCILEDLESKHQIFIAEVGAYNKGKVKQVCSMLKPKIGVVAGVNEQHLSLFGSLNNLLSAEGGGELSDSLPKDGLLVLNGDNKYCLDLFKRAAGNKKTYSIKRGKINSDIWTEDAVVTKNSISFVVIDKNKEAAHFQVNVLGKQNIQNLLAAILVAKELGMSLYEIAEACKNIKPEQAGMTLKPGKHGINIIDSSYSSNPDGVMADLEYLNIFPNKKVIIMPCLIELGKKSADAHEKIGQKIGKICDLAVITTKDKFEDVKRGAIYSGMNEKDIIFCENPDDIYSLATLFCTSGDTILLEGRVPARLINLLSE